MTSMPLTSNNVAPDVRETSSRDWPLPPGGGFGWGSGATVLISNRLPASHRRELLLRGVLLRGVVHHRAQQLVVGFIHVRRVAPLLAVPGVDARAMRAAVVLAGGLEGLHDALHAERLDARRVEVQVLRAPAHFLARHDPLAVFLLRLADRLDREHRRQH